jgi:hypothetical protein
MKDLIEGLVDPVFPDHRSCDCGSALLEGARVALSFQIELVDHSTLDPAMDRIAGTPAIARVRHTIAFEN